MQNVTLSSQECAFSPLLPTDLGWHIASIFFVLAASALGVFLPLALGNVKHAKVLLVLGKHIGTGALLSLGFIHLLFPAIEQLGNECLGAPWTEYPFALLFAMLSSMLMHLGEVVAHAYVHKRTKRTLTESSNVSRLDIERPPAKVEPVAGIENDFNQSKVALDDQSSSSLRLGGHNHGVLLHSREEEMVSALLLEGGLAVHSVIIGIALGIAEVEELAALIPALSFHQLFEGLAMGSQIAAVGFKSWKSILLAIIYTISAPVGVAIGIGIRSSYDPNSQSAALSQGILDAISGGIILYAAFVTMLAYEFSADFHEFKSLGIRVGMFAALWFGVGVLSLIGIWL
jgi:zinc transporter 1/2/3